jgi:hypothetical protein
MERIQFRLAAATPSRRCLRERIRLAAQQLVLWIRWLSSTEVLAAVARAAK